MSYVTSKVILIRPVVGGLNWGEGELIETWRCALKLVGLSSNGGWEAGGVLLQTVNSGPFQQVLVENTIFSSKSAVTMLHTILK
jgi:hypothetical protein